MSDLRKMLHGFADELAAKLEGQTAATSLEYYNQNNSPLPRETYLRLVRGGKVAGFKVQRLVLVRRADLHEFIEANRINPQLPFSQDNDAVAAAALAQLGMTRKAG